MTGDHICLLNTGEVCGYNAAFRLDYTGEISDALIFMGAGVIISVYGKKYKSNTRFKFYRVKTKNKGWI